MTIKLPTEILTGSMITLHGTGGIREIAKRKTKCQSCGDYILKGQERIAFLESVREWINGGFVLIRKARYMHFPICEVHL
jgi:hypothetical protein